jgi:DNA replication protein DnaC
MMSRRYERTNVAIATELSFSELRSVTGDPKMITALLDRLTRHCHMVEMGSESYRFRSGSTKEITTRKSTMTD